MESEDSPRAKRGGCFMCGARSPEPKREKKSDSLVDLSKLDFSIATLVAVLGYECECCVCLFFFFCFLVAIVCPLDLF